MKTSGRLWQHCRDEPVLNNNNIINFPANNNSISFKFKEKITGQTGHDDTKDIHKVVPLKYLSSFRRALELLSINCEINPIVTWSANYF